MLVAVPLVGMVQVIPDEIIRVIPVRHGFVAAPGAVLVPGVVLVALVIRRAALRIAVVHAERMLGNLPVRLVVQVTAVEVVHVAFVSDGNMAAAVLVFVVVSGVLLVLRHEPSRMLNEWQCSGMSRAELPFIRWNRPFIVCLMPSGMQRRL